MASFQRLGLHHVGTAVVAHHGEHVHVLRQLGVEAMGSGAIHARSSSGTVSSASNPPGSRHARSGAAMLVAMKGRPRSWPGQRAARNRWDGSSTAAPGVERRLVDLALQVAVQVAWSSASIISAPSTSGPRSARSFATSQLQPVRDGIVVHSPKSTTSASPSVRRRRLWETFFPLPSKGVVRQAPER